MPLASLLMNEKLKKTGLFFGSFNPIHIGHMVIANYMLEFTDIDKIWFVVSPQNPLKKKESLLADYHRFEMVYRACEDHFDMKAVDIEFKMPQPSYTIDTLVRLTEKYPNRSFVVLMGGDSLQSINKWKNYTEILKNYWIYVYKRPGHDNFKQLHDNIKIFDAPQMNISASFIRNAIKQSKDIRYLLPCGVWEYICEMHFYK
jgi:nicotinate-nucleotide adenylyltransferase